MRLEYMWNKELCEYFGLSKEDFENKTVKELNLLDEQMKKEKIENQKKRNKEDEEFIRIVKKFFKPYTYLLQFFNEEDVILACCNHLTERDIVDDYKTKANNTPWKDAEFIENRYEYMPQYDRSGRELAERKYESVNVFRVSARYQGIRHGDVILELLYKKYPQLEQYGFSAYEYHGYDGYQYEIYAKNGIYTPFAALMNKDIEAIKKRNIDYSKSYNYGEFTEAKVNERFINNQDFFDTINSLE